MRFTIAICTWNRADLLDQTLATMAGVRVPSGVEWEVLVVNNNCTDATDEVIEHHVALGKLPIRRLFEPKQGHSNARNCAIAAARGDLIIWTDDDVRVEAGWLEAYVGAARENPAAGYFGGPVRPWYESAPDPSILGIIDRLGAPLAILDLGDQSRPLAAAEAPLGANMAVRTDLLRGCLFRPDLGRSGNTLISGDEVDVIQRLRAAGVSGIWVPGAALHHYVPSSRITTGYLTNWFRGCGRTYARMGHYPNTRTVFGVPAWVLRSYFFSWFRRLGACTRGRAERLLASTRTAMYQGMIEEYRAVNRRGVAASRAVRA